MERSQVLFETLIRLADDHLILGHRLSQWCGHAPMLEEDLAMPNIALDLIGQARALYAYAGEVEARGRDEDSLAYLRLEHEYKNLLLVELTNGDFGQTMLRQFYFSVFMEAFWEECRKSSDMTLAAIAGKAVKEAAYHVRHSAQWVIRLGDGTEESHRRMRDAIDRITPYTGELFIEDELTAAAVDMEIIPSPASLRGQWDMQVNSVLSEATLGFPENLKAQTGGRQGQHREDMGYLLAELQYMQRTFPGMSW